MTVGGLDFVGGDAALRRRSSLCFGRRGGKRERKSARMYHSLRVNWAHRLQEKVMRSLRNRRKDWIGFNFMGASWDNARGAEAKKLGDQAHLPSNYKAASEIF